jgi:uncharacterized protein (TIGR03067 family)
MTDSIKEEKRKLQGIWTIQSVDTGSKSLSLLEGAAKGGHLVFEGDEVVFKGDGSTRMNYRVEPDSKPKAIDFVQDKDQVMKQGLRSTDRPYSSRPIDFVKGLPL